MDLAEAMEVMLKLLSVAALLGALMGCRPGDVRDLDPPRPQVTDVIGTAEVDPELFQPPLVLRVGDPICEYAGEPLLAAGPIVVRADANLEPVAECEEPALALFADSRDVPDYDPDNLYIRVATDRYLPLRRPVDPPAP